MRHNNFRLFVFINLVIFSFIISIQPGIAKEKDLSYNDKKAVDHTMRMLQINTENLHIAFDKRDWGQMEKLAMEIHDACAGLESRGDMEVPLEFDDFRIFSENMHDHAEKIVDASKQKDLDKAKLAYKDMEKTCVNCHRIFRK